MIWIKPYQFSAGRKNGLQVIAVVICTDKGMELGVDPVNPLRDQIKAQTIRPLHIGTPNNNLSDKWDTGYQGIFKGKQMNFGWTDGFVPILQDLVP